jgi:hypothetical protein
MDSSLADAAAQVDLGADSDAVRSDPARPSRRTRAVVAAFAASLFLVVLVAISVSPVDREVEGDEASYVFSALSLLGGDLSYDARDQQRWDELGWNDPPLGLFLQAHGDGWAGAKPIGYSIVLAPFLLVFGLQGIAVSGAALLAGYAACWYFSCRLRWSWDVSVVVAVTAALASYAWFYAFAAHPDLFFACLIGFVTYALLRSSLHRHTVWWVVACASAGLLLTEKVPALLAMMPFLLAASTRLRWRVALVGWAALVTVAALSIIPYWHYSDGASWSAYGGERYYAAWSTPWNGGGPEDLRLLDTDETMSPAYVFERVTSPNGDVPAAAITYVIGRHTGVLTFMPIVPILLVAAVVHLIRSRRAADGAVEDDAIEPLMRPCRGASVPEPAAALLEAAQRENDEAVQCLEQSGARAPARVVAWGAFASVVAYAAFYVVLFTNNYYGGGHSIGSRYFLQFSVVAIAVPVAGGLGERAATMCAALAVVWALVVLGPLLLRGDRMFSEFWHTTPVQRLLPYDATQEHPVGVWSGEIDRVGPPCDLDTRLADELSATTGTLYGTARVADPTRHEHGYLAFGPYCRLEPGPYRVSFDYSNGLTPEVVVGAVDVADMGAPLVARELRGTDGRRTRARLEFNVDDPARWEFRLFWAGNGDMTLYSTELRAVSP